MTNALVFIITLVLTVWDTDAGVKLDEQREFSIVTASPWGDSRVALQSGIERCREKGVEKARELSRKWREKYPYASTNVDCEYAVGDAL